MSRFREENRYMNIAFSVWYTFIGTQIGLAHSYYACDVFFFFFSFRHRRQLRFFFHHHHHLVNVFMRERKKERTSSACMLYTLMSISSLQTILSSILILNAGEREREKKKKIPKHILFQTQTHTFEEIFYFN